MIDPGAMLPAVGGAGVQVGVETISGSIAQGRLPAKAKVGGGRKQSVGDPVYSSLDGQALDQLGPQLSIDTTQKPGSPTSVMH